MVWGLKYRAAHDGIHPRYLAMKHIIMLDWEFPPADGQDFALVCMKLHFPYEPRQANLCLRAFRHDKL